MKKKIAVLSALVMAVVVTSYSVSGTYAKYISEIDISDEARVAKWEIGLNDNSMYTMDLFKDSYTYGSNGEVIKSNTRKDKCSEVPVDPDDLSKGMKTECTTNKDENVVAPGAHGMYSFKLKGDIETNYKITISADGSENHVVLANGTTIPKSGTGDAYDLAAAYSPLRFYIAKNGKVVNAADAADPTAEIGEDYTKIINGWMTWSEFKDALEALYTDGAGNQNVYKANLIDNSEYTIYWKWDYNEAPTKPKTTDANYSTLLAQYNEDIKVSRQDTLLGNRMVTALKDTSATTNTTSPLEGDVTGRTEYEIVSGPDAYKVNLKISITVEQTQDAATITDAAQF